MFADFGSHSKRYFVTDYGQRVGVVVAKGADILLIQQYRILIKRRSWEIPGGKVDEGESAKRAAVRECEEESGIRCRRLHFLLTFQPGLDTLHNPTWLFYSTEFREDDRPVNRGEVEQHAWIPLKKCLAMMDEGKIVDSLSVIALLAYDRRVQDRRVV